MELIQQLETELSEQVDYSFKTDRLTFSDIGLKDKKSYVTGYISVPEIDLYNDLITPNALKSMLRQITESTITLDYEHEAWRDDETILPVGKIIEAKVDDRGLWIKAELNKHSPKYKDLWGSIKGGFVNAFSIAFKPLKVVSKTIGDTVVQLIEDLKLLNVALTGNPANQGAKMTGYEMKSVMLKAINDTKQEKVLITKSLITKLMEEKNMEETEKPEEKVETSEETEESKTPEVTPEVTPEPEKSEVVEQKSEEPEEESKEPKEETETSEEKVVDLKAIVNDLKIKVEEQGKQLKELKEKPVFKSTISDNKPELKSEKTEMLNLIR